MLRLLTKGEKVNNDEPVRKKYNPRVDDLALRKLVEPAVQGAIQLVLGGDHYMKVHSSIINHTGLEPEGDKFTISLVVEVHAKPQPK